MNPTLELEKLREENAKLRKFVCEQSNLIAYLLANSTSNKTTPKAKPENNYMPNGGGQFHHGTIHVSDIENEHKNGDSPLNSAMNNWDDDLVDNVPKYSVLKYVQNRKNFNKSLDFGIALEYDQENGVEYDMPIEGTW